MLSAAALAWASVQAGQALPPPPDPAPVVAPAAVPAADPAAVASPASSEPPAVTPPVAPAAQPADPAADPQAIVVTARPKNDPVQAVNQASFKVTQEFDNRLVAPLTGAYVKALPRPARAGLHNVIRNLGEPVVFLNFLLQLKPGKALKTLGRFAINTTIGIGGLMDVAKNKPFNLPYRHNGFANTLGFYGVKPGPFLYLPFIGATSLRDLIGGAVDGLVLPMGIGAPFNKLFYTLPNGAIRSLDRRVEFDCQIKQFRSADDPYAAERSFYLRKRQAEIDALHGRGQELDVAAVCKDAIAQEHRIIELPPPAEQTATPPADQSAAPPPVEAPLAPPPPATPAPAELAAPSA